MFTSNIRIRGENVVLMTLILTWLLVPDQTVLGISETFVWRLFPGLVFSSSAIKAHPPQGSTCYVFWDAFLLNTAVKSAYVSLPSAQTRFDRRFSALSHLHHSVLPRKTAVCENPRRSAVPETHSSNPTRLIFVSCVNKMLTWRLPGKSLLFAQCL